MPVEGVELIVDSARTTSDGAVRSAALGALAAVAQIDPQQVRARTRKSCICMLLCAPICQVEQALSMTARNLEIGAE